MKDIEGKKFDNLKLLSANWSYIGNNRRSAIVTDKLGVKYSIEYDYVENTYHLSE